MSSAALAYAPLREQNPSWWTDAVFYQIYPRSFADANDDGTGDLAGITQKMDYLADLGVDALWLSPFYRSPMVDGGYDVADPTEVDPRFGTLEDFDAMVTATHARGIKVTVDIVPNHFSDQHVWFQRAVAAPAGSPERARFVFRDGRGPGGSQPPNNWISAFGGPAWTRLPDGQWYLHLFAPQQPDVNWENPEVRTEFARVLRFWLDRGADGFRIDVAHGMAKAPGLPDLTRLPAHNEHMAGDPRFDQPGVHEILRGFREVLDEYPGAMAVGEVWVANDARLAQYVRADELHLTFNFGLTQAPWGATPFRAAIGSGLSSMTAVGAVCTWVLSNHDVVRHATRYGGGPAGRRRAAAAALVQLSLPGPAYLYQGDELALENVDDLPEESLDDPTWERSSRTERGRDGERVPLPWSGTRPPYGFGGCDTWLPMPPNWAPITVEAQAGDPDSVLNMYRRALAVRRNAAALHGGELRFLDAGPEVLAYQRIAEPASNAPDARPVTVYLNTGPKAVPLPANGSVLVASGRLTDAGELPQDTAVWVRSDEPIHR